MNRVSLHALKANHMVMVMILIAAAFELDAILKDHLLQHTQFLHDTQVAVNCIKAEPAVLAAHMLINILRRQISRILAE
ncbi:hypothetical protein D3C71_1886760 [compost metagenome]